MTPRGTFGLCCVHILQLKTHSAVYTRLLTLQLCYKPLGIIRRVTTSQKVQISCLDVLQKLYNTNFAWHRSRGFLRDRVAKPEFRHSPISYLRTIKNNFPEIWDLYIILNEGREEFGLPILRHIVDIPVAIKSFKRTQNLTCMD